MPRGSAVSLSVSEKLQPRLDMWIVGIELSCSLVGIQRVTDLVVARLVQCAKIIPHLRDEGVEANSPRVRIQSITILVNLIIQNADRAPEGRIPTVAVHSLLIGFICLRVLLL